MKYVLNIFADYFQFYLQDDNPDLPQMPENLWTKQALADMCALEPGFIAVTTVRNMHVPVTIEIVEAKPEVDISRFDHIVECSIEIVTGQLVVIGCTGYFPDATRIPVTPGIYEAVLCYEKLNTLSENGLEGDDSYHINLYPGQQRELKVIKRHSWLF